MNKLKIAMLPKILVVDDINTNLILVEKSLSGIGAEILTSKRPNNALELAKRHEFALLILDVQMPQMIGFELADRIRNTEKNKFTPIIFLTGIFSDNESIFKGYRSGAVDYITLPFNRKILYSKVKVFLDLYSQKQELAEKSERFKVLAQFATDFQKISTGENIYKSIGGNFAKIYTDSLIFVNSYNPELSELKIEHAIDPNGILDEFQELIKVPLSEMTFQVSKEIHDEIIKTGIKKLASLSELTIGKIPEETCAKISQQINISEIYSSGFIWNDDLYGTISLVLTGEEKINNTEFIEAFIHQASLAIQKWSKDKSLLQSEEKFQKAFENSPEAIIISDFETGQIIDTNEGFAKIFGWELKELKKQNLYEIEIFRYTEQRAKLLREISSKNKIEPREVELLNSGGEVLTALLSSDIMYLEDKKAILSVINDITSIKKAEEKLMSSVIEAADLERKRIAAELHDNLVQSMTAASMNFNSIKESITSLSKETQELFTNGMSFLEKAMQESRSISQNLMPKSIEDFGLILTLESLLENIGKTYDTKFKFIHNLNNTNLSEQLNFNLYRITQEAINNTIKHAAAENAILQIMKHKDELIYTFEDDGKGIANFDEELLKKGQGLTNINNRVKSFGGEIQIDSVSGKGTMITINIPINND